MYEVPYVATLSKSIECQTAFIMSARILSQLPVALLDDIARLVSREQLSALQEVLKREASPLHVMSAWPPKDPRKVIDALGDRPVDEVRELLTDVGLDDAVPLLDEAATYSAQQKHWNMTARSIAFRTQTEPNSTTSTSISSSSSSSETQGKQTSGLRTLLYTGSSLDFI